MTIDPDYLMERKIHKSTIKKWQIAALLLAAALIFMWGRGSGSGSTNGRLHEITTTQYIGAVVINGILYEDHRFESKLANIMDNDSVKALIVNINSPGGTVVGAEKIYNILRKISEKKPVVVVMGTLAASGGYLISLAADHIIAHNGTITGSIGVIFENAEVTELVEKLGIKFESFKSAPLKAAPNPMEKVTPEVRAAVMSTVSDFYEFFTQLVAERRKIEIHEVQRIADGRIYTGRQALALKLIDAVGTTDDAVAWLQKEKNIDPNLEVKEISLTTENKLLDMILNEFDNRISSLFSGVIGGLKVVF